MCHELYLEKPLVLPIKSKLDAYDRWYCRCMQNIWNVSNVIRLESNMSQNHTLVIAGVHNRPSHLYSAFAKLEMTSLMWIWILAWAQEASLAEERIHFCTQDEGLLTLVYFYRYSCNVRELGRISGGTVYCQDPQRVVKKELGGCHARKLVLGITSKTWSIEQMASEWKA